VNDRIDIDTYIKTLLTFVDKDQPEEWFEKIQQAQAFLWLAQDSYLDFLKIVPPIPSQPPGKQETNKEAFQRNLQSALGSVLAKQEMLSYAEAVYEITDNNRPDGITLFEKFLEENPRFKDRLLGPAWKPGDSINLSLCQMLRVFYRPWNEKRKARNK
jgi:hypothetical protein